MTAELLARMFHQTYERLAPSFGYQTRVESRCSWGAIPAEQRDLMIATCAEVLKLLQIEKAAEVDKEVGNGLD